jgi:hypothetical protein
MRHDDRVLLSVRTWYALGAHEKPRRCKSLRAKGVAASDVGLEWFPTNHWAEEKRAALSTWGAQ